MRNDPEPYYGRTIAPPSDPNLLFDTRRHLDYLDILRPEENEATVALLLTGTGSAAHGKVYAQLDPAVERGFERWGKMTDSPSRTSSTGLCGRTLGTLGRGRGGIELEHLATLPTGQRHQVASAPPSLRNPWA